MPTIVLTNHYRGTTLEVAKKALPSGFDLVVLPQATREALLQAAPQADYFLASGRLAIDGPILDAASRLKMIQRTGVGTDTVDFEAMERRGIPFYVNRGVNSQSVAEHAVLLMLAVLRRLNVIDQSVRRGEWRKQELGLQTHELGGKTIGLLGLGNIGKITARIVQAFGARVIYHDIFRLPETAERDLDVTYRSLEELLAEADVLSLHCALTDDTRGLLNTERIASMKRGAVLVNTSRGPLIDESALLEALQTGQVRAAGLDAFATEPINKEHPFFQMDNVILTPHIGGVTYESFERMMREAMNNIKTFEAGDLDTIADRRLNP